MEHAYDHQEVLTLCNIYTKMRDFLSKARSKKKKLEEFHNKYLPTMNKLKEEKVKLHEATGDI